MRIVRLAAGEGGMSLAWPNWPLTERKPRREINADLMVNKWHERDNRLRNRPIPGDPLSSTLSSPAPNTWSALTSGGPLNDGKSKIWISPWESIRAVRFRLGVNSGPGSGTRTVKVRAEIGANTSTEATIIINPNSPGTLSDQVVYRVTLLLADTERDVTYEIWVDNNVANFTINSVVVANDGANHRHWYTLESIP
jgi:hypothetical protein